MKSKNRFQPSRFLLPLIVASGTLFFLCPALAAPKKILVVTVTKGFRHSSIPTAEKVLGELAVQDRSERTDDTKRPQEGEQGLELPKGLGRPP